MKENFKLFTHIKLFGTCWKFGNTNKCEEKIKQTWKIYISQQEPADCQAMVHMADKRLNKVKWEVLSLVVSHKVRTKT